MFRNKSIFINLIWNIKTANIETSPKISIEYTRQKTIISIAN